MSLTLLLDLDDTLLDTHLDTFMPAYFQALSQHMANYVAPDTMLRSLTAGLKRMLESEDPTHTLEEIFENDFYPMLGVKKEDLSPVFEEFYDHVFPVLNQHTQPRPAALPLIEWALSCGYRVAIATDPFFPRKATEHRLRWAGLDPGHFELISTFEHFHFSKTHPAYYAEVLGRLGWPEGPVLMVGNDVARDLLPAHQLGLKTFLIEEDSSTGSVLSSVFASASSVDPDRAGFIAGRGKLADLRPWLESIHLSALEPSFYSRDSILGIMASTPAVLRSLTSALTDEQWRTAPTKEDWAMNEIICHLRDTEREIHQIQFDLLIEKDGAFIPRPDSGVWASEREYLNLDGRSALAEFARARIDNLRKLKGLDPEFWERSARHAIFGPTNFLEVVSFVTDHDRLHVQQAWKTIKSV